MQITRLYATNFLSYEVLDLPLADRGLVLVDGDNQDTGGSNGAGKSAIFEALVWGLFGTTNRGLKADDIVRRDESRQPVNNTQVCVEINVDGKKVQVFRNRKHQQYNNKLLLFIDGAEVSMGSDRETQERLNSLLQIDRDAFVSAVMFPQGSDGFASLTDSGQKAILDRILGTERFAEAQVRIKEKLKKITTAVTRAESGTAAIAQAIQTAEYAIKDTGERITAWEADHAARIHSLNELRKKLSDSQPTIDAAIEAEVASLKATNVEHSERAAAEQYLKARDNRDKLVKQLEAARGRLAGVQESSEPLRPEPERSASSAEHAIQQRREWDSLHHRHASTLSNINGQIEAICRQLENVADECPTCGQLLPEDARQRTRDNLALQIKELRDRIPAIEAGRDTAKANFDAWTVEYDKATAHASWLREKASQEYRLRLHETCDREVEDLAEQVAPLEISVQELFDKSESMRLVVGRLRTAEQILAQQRAERSNWETKVSQIAGAIQAVEAEANPYQGVLEKEHERLKSLRSKLVCAEALQTALTIEFRYLSFWETGFGNNGVKSLLLDTVVPYLTNRASDYLGMLTNESATIEFQTQTTLGSGETREKFRIDVNYLYGGDCYEAVSGGEKRRVDLASLFALGDLAASRSLAPIRLRLLDEPFDNLDTLGSEQVVRILREKILPTAGTVLVMTHDDNLKALIEHRITVVKKNGVSKILGV